ncbi:metal-sensitive transcriptional regulator [Demequina sp. NBRC 110055]|uniref:metal-sensitive transcriptional regulator n=1 Tax=Demequina sp. NBRC 110055 TaxID=1570344 RepID=UPI000A04C2D4|nr:metal-sensitive transcriptional regulator [Demequina sp. NBRC 110055]
MSTDDVVVQRAALNRLKRARGQLDAVIRMVEEGQACEPTVTQLAAVSKALDRAGFMMISTGVKDCLTSDNEEGREEALERLEKVFMSLA